MGAPVIKGSIGEAGASFCGSRNTVDQTGGSRFDQDDADRVKAKFELHPERLIADSAYSLGPMPVWLADSKTSLHNPMIDKAGRSDGT